MSCSPAELKKKSDEFLGKWQACKTHPGMDGFVEFAVAVSRFTEFLGSKGLSRIAPDRACTGAGSARPV